MGQIYLDSILEKMGLIDADNSEKEIKFLLFFF